jgi:hypothetical protein
MFPESVVSFMKPIKSKIMTLTMKNGNDNLPLSSESDIKAAVTRATPVVYG